MGAYYAYQNYLPTLKMKFPGQESAVTPHDEEKVRKMMEARDKQQAIYDNAAKELHDKRKEEPPTKLGPISKQIAAKAKLRPGMVVVKCIKVRLDVAKSERYMCSNNFILQT